MTVKDLKETLINDELFEKIGFTYDCDNNLYVALNFGNIVTVESDGTTVQYNCDSFSDDEKEELLQDILTGDMDMDIEKLEEKYEIDVDYYYTFGEQLSECGATDF